MNHFWSNTIWYLLLLASSIAAIIVTYKKSTNHGFVTAFSIAVLGFTYCLEIGLLLFFDAYTYFPMLTPWYPFQDELLGNIFSQISVSTTAVLYCVLGLRSIFIFVFAGAYFLIDFLFERLGIYEHYWYRSVYTFFGFILYCWLVKNWYLMLTGSPYQGKKLLNAMGLRGEKIKSWLHTGTLFLGVFAAASNMFLTTQKVAGVQIFKSGMFADMSEDHTTTALLYGPVMIVLTILIHRWKRPAIYKAGALLLLFACHWVLYKIGILTVLPGWFGYAATLDVLGFYFWTVALDRLLKSSPTLHGNA